MTSPTPSPAPKITRVDRILAVVAALGGLLLVGDQLGLAFGARSHEVAHLLDTPPLWLWIPALLVVLGGAAVAVLGPRMGRDPRLVRVPLLILVLVGFIDGPVMPDVRPDSMDLDALGSVKVFGGMVEELAAAMGKLPATEADIEPALKQMPPPPFLIHGVRPAKWNVRVRSGCRGPATNVEDTPPGTYLYCLNGDASQVWITAVGLTSERYGAPEILSHDAKPVIAAVKWPLTLEGGPVQ
ncbi:MAG: hypothetical protein JST54_18200 [Deltaproteobacteria bacterium]|nr:hypothetical protein [Deltaproteobacteria bacterium]